MDKSELITLVLAIWGAGLATIEAILRLLERRPSIIVEQYIGIPPGATDGMPRLTLRAINRWDRAVTLKGSGLLLPAGIWRKTPWKGPKRSWHVTPWVAPSPDPRLNFPYELPPESSCIDMLNLWQVGQDLLNQGRRGKIKARGFFVDGAERLHASKPFTIDIEHWRIGWDGQPLPRPGFDPTISGVIRKLPAEATVVASDGKLLGTVQEVGEDFFFLNRGGQGGPVLKVPGHWVAETSNDQLKLSVTEEALAGGPSGEGESDRDQPE
jgi:hypothetical protein